MGRTNPTFRDQLRHLEEQWATYRRALRYDHQDSFDRLFEHARAHADASGHQNPTDPMPAILLSIALEHERHLQEFEAELEELQQALETLEALESSERHTDRGEEPANVDA